MFGFFYLLVLIFNAVYFLFKKPDLFDIFAIV